ncbi:MAG: mRNA surveillance protein Pelota [Aeropyrum sp.]|nr:mRNA surveillance protein Pelota [Aeropyrum sp.]
MKVEVLDNRGKVVRLRPESDEDLWLLRISLRRGDQVTLRTSRDVQVGSGKRERVAMTLKLVLDSVEFQPFTGKLRISGIVVEGPEEFGVKGRRHSTAISIGQQLVVERSQGWRDHELEKLRSGAARGTAAIAAVDYDEVGLAVLASHGLKMVEDRSSRLPGKEDPAREEEVKRYVEYIASRIVREASRHNARIAVIVGPGNLKREVASLVSRMAPGLRVIVADAAMGGQAGVREALRRESITKALEELSIIEAEGVVEEFLKRISRSPETVAYTPREVLAVAKMGAVEKLVVVDSLLYSMDDETREAVDKALAEAEARGGRVVVIPEDSPPGERVRSFGGVIALLRFQVPSEARRL